MGNVSLYCGQLDVITHTMSEAEDTAHPLLNLKTYFSADQWWSSTTAVNQSLIFTKSSAFAANFLLIENHNLHLVGGDRIKLQAADDAAFTSNVTTLQTDITPGSAAAFIVTFTSNSQIYTRIRFEASAPLSVVPKIGNAFLNTSLDFGMAQELPFNAADSQFDVARRIALDGAVRTSYNYEGRKKWKLVFKLFTNTIATNFQAFHDKVRGECYPFYFLDHNAAIWYVHFDASYNAIEAFRVGYNNIGIQLSTQLVGATAL